MSNEELWLEFGYLEDNDWHEMLWYNEGRPEEITYFMNELNERIKGGRTGPMYFKARYGKDNQTEIIL
jgi:hypothetical protein